MTHKVFTYGTLMFPEVMEAVTDIQMQPEFSSLSDYCRYAIKGQCFPGIVEQAGANIEGMLYSNINDETLAILDWFESVIYERRLVRVSVNNTQIDAYAYVVTDEHRNLFDKSPWDPDRFLATHFETYLQRCRGYRSSGEWK